jgi:thiamine-phosphate pyrophosphorylase
LTGNGRVSGPSQPTSSLAFGSAPRSTDSGSAGAADPRHWVLAPPKIYAIADLGALGEDALPASVAAMATAGVRWIQLRAKGASGALAWRLVAECCRRLDRSGVALWVDDRVDLGAVLPLGGIPVGVHLGQRDLPPAAARRVLGPAIALGLSTHDSAQVQAAADDPAVDVVAVGPVFQTRSKAGPDPVVGLSLVRAARTATRKPVVAIGGIDESNLAAVLEAGADAVAVLSAIRPGDVSESCRRLLQAAERAGRGAA